MRRRPLARLPAVAVLGRGRRRGDQVAAGARRPRGGAALPRAALWLTLVAGTEDLSALLVARVNARIPGSTVTHMAEVGDAAEALFFSGSWSRELFRGWRHSVQTGGRPGIVPVVEDLSTQMARDEATTAHEAIAIRRELPLQPLPGGIRARPQMTTPASILNLRR
jgi:hypothetical protein